MATAPRKSFAKVMTPQGTFVYPKLNKPDQYKDGKPTYAVKVRLNADESQALIAKIEAELLAYWPIAKAEYEQKIAEAVGGAAKAKAKIALEAMKEADKSYKPAYDDEGNETGEYEFNFKMPAEFKSTKGASAGKLVKMKPDLFDAAGKPLANPPEIWGGSTGCVAGELRPFSMPIGVGISLRLKAVQLITVRSGGGSQDAAGYGFGAQDGYERDESEDAGFGDKTDGAAPSSDDSGNEEF